MQEKRLFVIGFGRPAKQRPKAEWQEKRRKYRKRGKIGTAAKQQYKHRALTGTPKGISRKKVTRWVAGGWLVAGRKTRYPAMATAVSSGDDLTDFQSQSLLPHFPRHFCSPSQDSAPAEVGQQVSRVFRVNAELVTV